MKFMKYLSFMMIKINKRMVFSQEIRFMSSSIPIIKPIPLNLIISKLSIKTLHIIFTMLPDMKIKKTTFHCSNNLILKK